MKFIPKKVFILENGSYIELSYQEFSTRCKSTAIYQEKKLIPLHGMLMEVTEDVYEDFCKSERRQRYLDECSPKNREFSYDMLTTDDFNGEDILVDRSQDILEDIINQEMLEKLREAVLLLSDEEMELIQALFYDGLTEREYARKKGIYHNAVHKRKIRILAKIKKILEI